MSQALATAELEARLAEVEARVAQQQDSISALLDVVHQLRDQRNESDGFEAYPELEELDDRVDKLFCIATILLSFHRNETGTPGYNKVLRLIGHAPVPQTTTTTTTTTRTEMVNIGEMRDNIHRINEHIVLYDCHIRAMWDDLEIHGQDYLSHLRDQLPDQLLPWFKEDSKNNSTAMKLIGYIETQYAPAVYKLLKVMSAYNNPLHTNYRSSEGKALVMDVINTEYKPMFSMIKRMLNTMLELPQDE